MPSTCCARLDTEGATTVGQARSLPQILDIKKDDVKARLFWDVLLKLSPTRRWWNFELKKNLENPKVFPKISSVYAKKEKIFPKFPEFK